VGNNKRIIHIDDLAFESLNSILLYLYTGFGEKIGDAYFRDFEIVLSSLAENPAMYPLLDKKNNSKVHKCVFKKLTIILYRFDYETLYIHSILDARSNWQTIIN
jgi:plasmid stabilization system protein ParE